MMSGTVADRDGLSKRPGRVGSEIPNCRSATACVGMTAATTAHTAATVTSTTRRVGRSFVSVPRSEVDGQRQDPVVQRRSGVADDGEVHEVALRLLEEARPLLAGDGGQRTVLHRLGTLLEALDH